MHSSRYATTAAEIQLSTIAAHLRVSPQRADESFDAFIARLLRSAHAVKDNPLRIVQAVRDLIWDIEQPMAS